MLPASVVDALLSGRQTGIAKHYVSKIEMGRRTGTAQTLKAIAEALDVDMDMNMGDERRSRRRVNHRR